MRPLFFLPLVLCSMLACSGRTMDVGQSDGAVTGAPEQDDEPSATDPRCDAPHGPLDEPVDQADRRAKLVGRWLLCSEPKPFYLARTSIEFADDGHWYKLVPDGNGDYVRAQGIDSEGEWKAQDEPSTAIEPGPFFADFETSPRRFRMLVATAGDQSWYISLD